ncbi:MAG: efflux RND transporter periplasmic adaptor subunit [Planctomycetaceae bacterium]|nr:efflux RND transporter periplasmic adaptor subunit [Planctomycetaceae bacterium]
MQSLNSRIALCRTTGRQLTPWLFLLVALAVFSLSPGGSQSLSESMALAEPPASEKTPNKTTPVAAEQEESLIIFPQSKWESSNVEISKSVEQPYVKTIRLTGKVSLNEDRISHVYPMVEGAVDKVGISLGDVVEANQQLIVIHSREVGVAKLELFQARLREEMAIVKDTLQKELATNTRELLTALRNWEDITEIQARLSDKNMGEFRERLLIAYSDYIKSQADMTRLEEAGDSGAVSGKQLLAARAKRNSDLAAFQARVEQIAYELETSLLSTSQAVRQANTEVAVATTSLRILGCDENEIADINPLDQGESISHYQIRAPFKGTVIAKDVTLGEQVRPDNQILTIADLSTVWIETDIFEKDIPLLALQKDAEILVTSEAWPGKTFAAQVFYTGEVMDESTRTVSMRAIAPNAEHMLKPGMFVTVQLQLKSAEDSVQVPSTAVQLHEGRHFVFVHQQGDQFVRRDVQLGRTDRNWSVVESGLTREDTVVTSGGFILKSKMLEELLAEE